MHFGQVCAITSHPAPLVGHSSFMSFHNLCGHELWGTTFEFRFPLNSVWPKEAGLGCDLKYLHPLRPVVSFTTRARCFFRGRSHLAKLHGWMQGYQVVKKALRPFDTVSWPLSDWHDAPCASVSPEKSTGRVEKRDRWQYTCNSWYYGQWDVGSSICMLFMHIYT